LAYAAELALLGRNLLKRQKWGDAEASLRDCQAIREQKQPDDWTTFSTRSLLGEALSGQKKYADAEPLLISGEEGLKLRAAKIPAQAKVRLTEALQGLIDLYTDWDKPDDAAKWQKALEQQITPKETAASSMP